MRTRSSARPLAALVALALPAVHAQTAEVTAPATTLEPIVVSATRSGAPAFEVPASIDAVDAEAIERAVPGVNLSEMLGQVPGVLVRDRQNYAQDQQLSIRGFGTRAPFGIVGTRLYVDGVPATMPDGAGQVSHFNLDTAERIEVLRGPFSALYGNAAGGVVQLFTAPGSVPTEVTSTLGGGSWGAARHSVSVRGVADRVDYTLGYTLFRTDGYRDHSQAERVSSNARVGFEFEGGTTLTLVANSLWLPEAKDPLGLTRAQFEADPRRAGPSAAPFDTRKSVYQAQLGGAARIPLSVDLALDLSTYVGRREIEQYLAIPATTQGNPLHSGGVVDLDNLYAGTELRGSWRARPLGRPLTLTAGLAYDQQDSERRGYENFSGTTLGVRGALRRDEQNRIHGFDQFLQLEWSAAERWLLMAGARNNRVDFRSDDRYVTPDNPDDSGRLHFSDVTPVAGVLWRTTPALHLHASFGEGFDSPTFAELAYRPDGQSGLNTALRPARTRSGELGAKWRFGSDNRVNAALFLAQTRDEIVVASSQGGRSTYQNGGRARRAGAELGSELTLLPRLRAELAATLLDARFREPFRTCIARCAAPDTTVAANKRVPGVARTLLNLGLVWGAEDGWSSALRTQRVGSVAVNSANSEQAPEYWLLGIDAGFTLNIRSLRLRSSLRLDNLLDEEYAGSVIVNDANGQYYEPGAGRSAFLELDARWRW